jgi:phosphoglycolate phosphatase-like HAD superfamily hydrolase
MPAIQLVVFDMIGTVLYDDHAIEKSLRTAFQSVGLFVDQPQIASVMGMEKREAITYTMDWEGQV